MVEWQVGVNDLSCYPPSFLSPLFGIRAKPTKTERCLVILFLYHIWHFVFVSYLVLNLLISIYFALNPFLFDFYLQFYPSVFSFSWFLYEVWSSFFWLFFFYFDCFFFLISSLIIWFHFIFISNLVFILSIALCFMLDHFLLIFFLYFILQHFID
jgi:hypothetical protein